MNKFRWLIILLLMGAVFIAPLKIPTCPKQSVNVPTAFSFALTPCSFQQVISGSCSATSHWIQDEFQFKSQLIVQNLIGLLFYFVLVTKYKSPLDEFYRPPI